LAESGPDRIAGLDPAQYKKKKKQAESGPPAQLAQTVLAKVCLAKHTLMPCPCILSPPILISGQTNLVLILENSKNIRGSSLIYL